VCLLAISAWWQTVRPIFWSNRPRAYLARTRDWDAFPSGRWGNAASPAYGTLSDYQFMRRHASSDKRRAAALEAWGAAPSSLEDVKEVFVNYCQVGAADHDQVSCCLQDMGWGG
jgi:methylenetetrahydrofolate reductase (NADPH)